jgi:competence protein ComEA
MPTPSKPQLAIYAACAIAILLVGAHFLRSGGAGESVDTGDLAALSAGTTSTSSAGARATSSLGPGSGAAAAADASEPTPDTPDGKLLVDVKGAVRRPGVYRLPAGARALDAVRRAGGLAHSADRVGVNLAARVVDGGEVVVPGRGAGGANGPGRGVGAGGSNAAGSASAGAAGAGSASGKAAGPVSLDLNTATAEQLEQLDGVGPATAAKIVAYRTQHGGISSVDQLDDVSGIGPAKLAAIRAQLGR